MNRDKQIAEMQLVMLNAIHHRYFNTDGVKANNENEFLKQAEALYNAGYRKASDVAREIIDILKSAGIDKWRYPVIAEIEKKYTEGER